MHLRVREVNHVRRLHVAELCQVNVGQCRDGQLKRGTPRHELPAPREKPDVPVADLKHIALALVAVEVKGNEPDSVPLGLRHKTQAGTLVYPPCGRDDEIFQDAAADAVLGVINPSLQFGRKKSSDKGVYFRVDNRHQYNRALTNRFGLFTGMVSVCSLSVCMASNRSNWTFF